MTAGLRCPAAHRDDGSLCDAPPDTVRVTDRYGGDTLGCIRHGAALLANLDGGSVHLGPGGQEGDAIEAYRRAEQRRG